MSGSVGFTWAAAASYLVVVGHQLHTQPVDILCLVHRNTVIHRDTQAGALAARCQWRLVQAVAPGSDPLMTADYIAAWLASKRV